MIIGVWANNKEIYMDGINEILKKVRECQKEEELFELVHSNMPGVALEVAKSAFAGPRILESLTRHHSITVRHEVAKNKNTALETLQRLSSDKDMLVRDYARRTAALKLQSE